LRRNKIIGQRTDGDQNFKYVWFSALPKGLSDEQVEEVAVTRHLPQPACDSRSVLASPISQRINNKLRD
jgi:hypothetical protein